ncbi:hypothetical protein MXB_108, partial [Myxobolus squamalis]
VTSQLKIFTTALLSVLILKKRLSLIKWIALLILFVGVVMANWSPKAESETNKSDEGNILFSSTFIGLTCIITCTVTSALSGVWYEKLLKREKSDVIMTNVQMSLSGLIFCLIAAALFYYRTIYENGLFVGFNKYVWIYICMQAFLGLIVSAVIKYTDNILKGFASSISIVLSAMIYRYLFPFVITGFSVTGTFLVIVSIIMYSYE